MGCLGGGRGPGLGPAAEVLVLCFAKEKYPKERRPPVCDPFALLRGNLRRGGCGVRRGTHCAASQLRSGNHGESGDEAWALRRPCSPRNRPDAGAASRGWEPARAVALLGPGSRAQAPRAAQVGPSAAKGRSVQGRPFFGDFLSATRKKVTRPPGRTPGLRPSHKHPNRFQKHSCQRLSYKHQKPESLKNQRGISRGTNKVIYTKQLLAKNNGLCYCSCHGTPCSPPPRPPPQDRRRARRR